MTEARIEMDTKPRGAAAEPTAAAWMGRFLRLQVGLFFFAAGVATMVEAQIGLDPWSSFHQGASQHLGCTFGTVTQCTGILLIGVGFYLLITL